MTLGNRVIVVTGNDEKSLKPALGDCRIYPRR